MEAGLFKMLVPQSLGGSETDPETFCHVIEELSRVDASTGWSVFVPACVGLAAGSFPEDVAWEIFGKEPNACVAGSGVPASNPFQRSPDRAIAVEGGYRVTGRWSFTSGCMHATWLMGSSDIYDGDNPRIDGNGKAENRAMYFPISTCQIIDTWRVTGLRGSGSHDFAVTDVFVPHEHSLPRSTPVRPLHSGALYAFAAGVVPAVAVYVGTANNAAWTGVSSIAQAGMAVAVTARTESEIQATVQEIEQGGGRALAIPADVTDASAVAQMVAEVERQLGPVDLLVNNAGVAQAFALIVEIGEDEWWREMEVNLRGPFLCARAVLPTMIARRRGRIINVASRGGLIVFERASAYCVSKAALIRLSQFLAAETKEQGIAVFAIHPGTVRTPMNEYMRTAEIVRQRAPLIQQNRQKIYDEGTDDPIEQSVDLVLLLASGKADALSGRFLSIDDDVNELVRRIEEIQRADLYTLQLHKVGKV